MSIQDTTKRKFEQVSSTVDNTLEQQREDEIPTTYIIRNSYELTRFAYYIMAKYSSWNTSVAAPTEMEINTIKTTIENKFSCRVVQYIPATDIVKFFHPFTTSTLYFLEKIDNQYVLDKFGEENSPFLLLFKAVAQKSTVCFVKGFQCEVDDSSLNTSSNPTIDNHTTFQTLSSSNNNNNNTNHVIQSDNNQEYHQPKGQLFILKIYHILCQTNNALLHLGNKRINYESICGTLQRKSQTRFVKIVITPFVLEATSVLQQLATKQLHHSNIVHIDQYYCKKNLIPNQPCTIVSVTESEVLYTCVDALDYYRQKKTSWLLQWFIPHVVMAALDGLDYLHEHEMYHGDVSFSNLMFRKSSSYDITNENQYIAVWIDLNNCLDKQFVSKEGLLKEREEFGFKGTAGFYPLKTQFSLPNEFTDCYGVIVVFCTLLYIMLFDCYDTFGKENEKLHSEVTKVLEEQYWTTKEMPCIQTLKELFETVVCKEDQQISIKKIRTLFQQCISNSDNSNPCLEQQ